MNRVQHQTKKKKVFVDSKNAAFSRSSTAASGEESPSSATSSSNSSVKKSNNNNQASRNKNLLVGGNGSTTNNNDNNSNSVATKTPIFVKEVAYTCCICCEESTVRTVFENCNHVDICHKCTLRLRVLNNDNRCCICKNVSENVIFTKRPAKAFTDYNKDDLIYDDTWKIYTEDYNLMNEITALRRIECKLCRDSGVVVTFENTHLLNNHTNDVHKLNYCSHCLKSRKVFLSEQKLYTWTNLMKHVKFGEEDPNYGKIEGHPLCKFCNIRFYSDDEIFDHMYKNHERCFICQKHGVQFEFYQNYKHLERHFDEKHYLCPHEDCRQQGFKVFENELDLMSHKNKVHSTSASLSKRGKVILDFGSLSVSTHTPSDDERRLVRTGEINSSIIRFIDTGGDGYHNDNIHKKQDGGIASSSASSSGKNKQKNTAKKEKQNVDSNAIAEIREKNMILVRKMKESLTEGQYQDLKYLSTQFLRGETLASEYYSKTVSMLGEEKTNNIFELLIEAIPPQDENKKKALTLARSTYHSAEFNPSLNQPKEPSQGEQQPNWPTLSNSQQQSNPSWNPQNPQPQKPKKEKKKPTAVIGQNGGRAPDLLWGVVGSTAPVQLNKEQEFPSLAPPPSTTSSSKSKKSSSWTKPLKEEGGKKNKDYTEFGNIKVYKFSDGKKKKK